jgi:hypothetical protein
MAWSLKPRRTGLRDISAELRDGWAGVLTVERVGDVVWFRGQLDGAAATSDIPWLLPSGFRPGIITSGGRYEYGSGLASSAGGGPISMYRINHYNNRLQLVAANGAPTLININHQIRARDAFPTAYPGVGI